jgi:hypothetical protein
MRVDAAAIGRLGRIGPDCFAVATMPTIDIRNISDADAPARPAISPVVKKRLNAGKSS